MPKYGIGIAHYNRPVTLPRIVGAVLDTVPPDTRVVLADDGSADVAFARKEGVILIQGPNKGVGYNKNRCLWGLQDCQFIVILEDDLIPTKKGWMETYERASTISGIHHFSRVQDKEVPERIPEFSSYMGQNGLSPIYSPSPRGDLTFLTSRVLAVVGGFNPQFKGVGYAHGEWTRRVIKAGLVKHPNQYVDIREARDSFVQIGDREGGRWNQDPEWVRLQVDSNREVQQKLDESNYIYHPLVLE